MNLVGRNSHTSRLLGKHLDRKYRLSIASFTHAKSPDELELLWRRATNNGDVAGAYWALLTHPAASGELVEEVFGEVHMLSHLSGAVVRVDLQELNRLRRRTRELENQLTAATNDTRRRLNEKEKKISLLERRLGTLDKTERELQQTREKLQNHERNPLSVRIRVEKLTANLAAARLRAERLEASSEKWKRLALRSGDLAQRLEERLAESKRQISALEASLIQMLNRGCPGSCNAVPVAAAFFT